ncbi:MAG: YfbM family protein [Lawsonibacter sp.]|nr:YfbM family protein [Lawsonibacter sp.]
MSCLGGFRAITKEELDKLRAVPRADRLPDYLDNVMVQEDTCDLDKAWDAIHRALTNGKLEYGGKHAPGSWVILGGEVLRGDQAGEEDYIVTCKNPHQVLRVSRFLQTMPEEAFRVLYFSIDPEEYGFELSEDDFEYTWSNLEDSIPFWNNAAEKGFWVLFDVDQ